MEIYNNETLSEINNNETVPETNNIQNGLTGELLDKKPNDDKNLWDIFTFQCILTVICAIIVVFYGTFFKDGFTSFKDEYNKLLNFGNLEVVGEQINGFFNRFIPGQTQGEQEQTQGEQEQEQKQQESENGESQVNQENKIVENESPSELIPQQESMFKNESPYDTGFFTPGDINIKQTLKNEILYLPYSPSVPDNATFSPVSFPTSTEIPYTGMVSSDFGWRINPFTHQNEFHLGIDVAGNNGDPIKSAAKGEVIFAGYGNKLGNYITIDHGGGFLTRYAHCEVLNVKEGDFVKKGQIIAKIGSTGQSTGNHLHFEAIKNGVWVNPVWLYD